MLIVERAVASVSTEEACHRYCNHCYKQVRVKLKVQVQFSDITLLSSDQSPAGPLPILR